MHSVYSSPQSSPSPGFAVKRNRLPQGYVMGYIPSPQSPPHLISIPWSQGLIPCFNTLFHCLTTLWLAGCSFLLLFRIVLIIDPADLPGKHLIPTLQMQKQRHREVESLGKDFSATQSRRQVHGPVLLAPGYIFLMPYTLLKADSPKDGHGGLVGTWNRYDTFVPWLSCPAQ